MRQKIRVVVTLISDPQGHIQCFDSERPGRGVPHEGGMLIFPLL